jgi:DNA repair protein RecN (Recombination protein N)
MLTSLSIKNYALIDNLSVNFKENLSIITGETGAGKSILLGALGLVLGNRADSSALKNNMEKCTIEAIFSISNYNLETFFDENDLDFEIETIIRREILPNGKSRAFINDTPTTLNVLQSLSEQLIDVHSQHQTLQLAQTDFQFKIIDALANTETDVEDYKNNLTLYNKKNAELKKLLENQNKFNESYQYNLHLFTELDNAKLKAGEQEQIEQELDKLNHIEEIKINLAEAHSTAFLDDLGIQSLLNKFVANMSKIASYSADYKQLFERINSVKIEFDDIANELDNMLDTVDFDPSELEKLNHRLELIYNLQKKHNVTSIIELQTIKEQLFEKIQAVENFSFTIEKMEKELQDLASKTNAIALIIHKKRVKAIPVLKEKLETILSNLGMANTRFKFNLEQANTYFSNGKDILQIQLSANKGVNFGDLKKIASGGEMSRIMLAVKAILSEFLKLPTIIFDEIDSGVSGDISQRMAEIMREMSINMQVITITHLPQIAAKGHWHYKVFKTELANNVVTEIRQLDENERIAEIAEMLSGKNISQTALEHAKQLLN